MNPKLKFLLLALLPLVMLSLAVIAYRAEASRKQPALVVLQSSERILQDHVGVLATTPSREEIYAFRLDSGSIAVYDKEYRRSKDIVSERPPGALAAGPNGQIYLADTALNKLRMLDQSGRSVGEIPVPRPISLAVLSSGNIVVASGSGEKLMRMFGPDGREISEKFGNAKRFDLTNVEQNRFLNGGKVVVGPSDVIYFVSKHATAPTIQKYSSTGQLLSELVVEGAAIDYQLDVASNFLSEKDPNTVGGFHIITSASVDPVTGNLWIGMNGTSKAGVVYEYNADGEKLREYAFLTVPPSGPRDIITGVKDLVVKTPWIYILTWGGEVYRFNLGTSGTRISELQEDNGSRKNRFERGMAYLTSFTRMFSTPAKSVSTLPQLPCPTEQPLNCTVNCRPGVVPPNRDCGAEIRMRQGDRVIGTTCSTPGSGAEPSCTLTATLCNVSSGVRVTQTVTITCPAPPSGGGGDCSATCNPCEGSDPCCISGYCENGCCTGYSPILVDVEGDGYDLTDASGGVDFDMIGNGDMVRLGWTSAGSDDAWLFLDRNNNGLVDGGWELFGNLTPQPQSPSPNGFIALAEFDKAANGGNGDGQIDSRDSIYRSLRLWQDTNHNGFSERIELHTLISLGVAIMDLDYKEARRRDQHGNWFRYRAKVKDVHGAQVGRWAWDVWLVALRR